MTYVRIIKKRKKDAPRPLRVKSDGAVSLICLLFCLRFLCFCLRGGGGEDGKERKRGRRKAWEMGGERKWKWKLWKRKSEERRERGRRKKVIED
jgi:hypothetical protein